MLERGSSNGYSLADQLCSYCEAILHLCFAHMQNVGFLMTRLNYFFSSHVTRKSIFKLTDCTFRGYLSVLKAKMVNGCSVNIRETCPCNIQGILEM